MIDANLGTRPVYVIRATVADLQSSGQTLRDRARRSPGRDLPRDGQPGDPPMTGPAAAPARVARLSYFFPAHNEEANLEGLVVEALEALPTIAETFEIIAVDDGSKDRTARDRRPPGRRAPGRRPRRPPRGQPGLRRRPALRLRGVALRAAVLHRRRPPVPGGGPRPADRPPGRGRTTPTSWSATGSSAPTRSSGSPTPATYKLANRIFFGLRVRDVDCACQAVPARGARGRPGRIRWRLLLGRAAGQDRQGGPHRSSRSACPHYRGPPARRPAPGPR